MNCRILNSIWALVFLASCATSQRNSTIVKDMEEEMQYYIAQKTEPTIQKDDRLIITVDSKIPELALPFKMPGATVQVASDGNITTNQNTSASVKGYKVDMNGNIDFPVLGTLHVEGLTLSQLKNLLHDRIVQGHFINDPLIVTSFANFKIITLGEINSKGIITVDEDKITLLEVVAKAGGITENGRPDRVNVIREVNNRKQLYRNDIQSTGIFKSPTYYLQQGDIVYVEPQPVKKKVGENLLKYGAIVLSVIATILTVSNLFK